MLFENKLSWYAVQTKPRSEKKVFERLKKEGFEVLLPVRTELRQWSDRKKKIQTPLIPSYVFVKVLKKNLILVLKDPGVVRVLQYLGKPAVVKEHEIENLKIFNDTSGELKFHSNLSYKIGEPIEVIRGPFKGVVATYLKERGNHRIVVNLTGFQKTMELVVPMSHIRRNK